LSSHDLLTLGLAENVLWFLGGFGPSVAAVLLVSLTRGRSGLKDFFQQALAWKVVLRWHTVALLLPLALVLAALGLHLLLGGSIPTSSQLHLWYLVPPMLVVSLITGPISEEFGWRGVSLPYLQAQHHPQVASLFLGLVWGLWHPPLFFVRNTPMAASSLVRPTLG
jgi:uncharacterized protein